MYYRKRHGRGFTYRTESGKTIKDAELRDWFESLVIPPAWTEVVISEDKQAKVLVTGRDDKGRKQYIYSPAYIEKKKKEKFDRIIRFAERLETMRRVTGQHMRHEQLSKKKVCATMVRLMDQAFFRLGNTYYTEQNNTYGLTTMRSKHITIDDEAITFSYTGKSGKDQLREVYDERLARVVQELDEVPGYRIFNYFDENGDKQVVESTDLNDYIQEVMGEEFSAKDFRTWAGTMVAAIALDELGAVKKDEQEKLDANIQEAIYRVSEMLGNTPAVAKSSYIDPRVIDNYMDGRTVQFFAAQAQHLLESGNRLRKDERLVLCMLKEK